MFSWSKFPKLFFLKEVFFAQQSCIYLIQKKKFFSILIYLKI